MILPLLTTGFKIFQGARKKVSSGSKMASNIVQGKGSAGGSTAAVTQDALKGDFVVGGRSKISATKFLQTTPDPSKSKATSKGGIFEAFASIINTINKFLSNILSTLIGDNKLTKKESDDERKKLALVTKRQRESNIEADKDGGEETTTKSKSKSKGSFFDRIIKFVTAIAIGSLVLALYRRFTDIIKFFKDTYETIKGFFEKLGEFVSPLWNIFKWITSKFLNIFKDVKPNDDQEYADKIEKELKGQDQMLKDIENEAGTTAGEVEGVDNELEKAEAEAKDDRTAVENYRSDIASNDIVNTNPVINIASDETVDNTVDDAVDDPVSEIKIADTKKGEVPGVEPPKPERQRDEVEEPKVEPKVRKISKETILKLTEQYKALVEKNKTKKGLTRRENFDKNRLKIVLDTIGVETRDITVSGGATIEDLNKAITKQNPNAKEAPRFGDVGGMIKFDNKDNKKLDSIEKVLGEQSSVNNKLADSIALLAQSEEEDDSPIIVPIPKQKTKVVGGSGGSQLIVMGGDSVNSVIKKVNLSKLSAV